MPIDVFEKISSLWILLSYFSVFKQNFLIQGKETWENFSFNRRSTFILVCFALSYVHCHPRGLVPEACWARSPVTVGSTPMSYAQFGPRSSIQPAGNWR